MASRTMHGGEMFVPKIPSMRIVDLVEAVAPGCAINEIGIRPGEKLHELMIPPDDAPRTREFDKHYIVCPDLDYWDGSHYNEAKRVPDRFEYSSDKNTDWLTVPRMRAMLVEMGLDLADREPSRA
jgi:UDP-N-acetylglucosamine 4,6-dehydratase/5-epimerase